MRETCKICPHNPAFPSTPFSECRAVKAFDSICPEVTDGTAARMADGRPPDSDPGRNRHALCEGVALTLTHLPDLALEGIPFYPMTRAASCPLDPAPALGDLQAKGPFVRVRLWDDSTAWLVTRHAEARALLADPRVSADPYRPGYPFQSQGLRDITDETQTFLNMDDPEHARLRRMVAGAFTVRRIEGLRPVVGKIVDDLVSDLLAGPIWCRGSACPFRLWLSATCSVFLTPTAIFSSSPAPSSLVVKPPPRP
jgi:hypothetical protein